MPWDADGKPVRIEPWAVAQTDETPKAGTFDYPSARRVIWFTRTACPDELDAIDLASNS